MYIIADTIVKVNGVIRRDWQGRGLEGRHASPVLRRVFDNLAPAVSPPYVLSVRTVISKPSNLGGDRADRVSKTLSEAEACVSDEAERGGPSTVCESPCFAFRSAR